MTRRLVILACTALAAAPAVVALTPRAADAQRIVTRRGQPARATIQARRARPSPGRQLSLSVGALRYEPEGDDNHPMAALRADWRLRHWLRSELGVSYALASLDVPSPVDGPAEEINSSLVAATVGVQAELPFRYVRPYVGAAAGLFARFDEDTDTRDDDSFVRPTLAVPLGVRLVLTPRLGLRAEARWRFDEHRDGRSVPNVEQTVGVSFGF